MEVTPKVPMYAIPPTVRTLVQQKAVLVIYFVLDLHILCQWVAVVLSELRHLRIKETWNVE